MEAILSVKGLCKTYVTKSNSNTVLDHVDLTVGAGEFVAVMGPSGSGKSTLLYTVSGMDKPTSGDVVFSGKNMSGMGAKALNRMRLTEMGFIFQQMYMMKKLSILDNILLPGFQANNDRAAVRSRADELMKRLGITETARSEITEVSGGQLQRACLCRALINSPKIIFADEPTGALNSKAAGDVMRELVAANRGGTACLMVTHSERVAAQSDRVIYLVDGGIRGELVLGKIGSEDEISAREKQLRGWLGGLGW
ncbi:MAG: ABC transporter ATP-binding protein [Oscillospiraceae bacterium]|nr:ABC transporter ATP-binding protein [Oscillospiraceae bacterium]